MSSVSVFHYDSYHSLFSSAIFQTIFGWISPLIHLLSQVTLVILLSMSHLVVNFWWWVLLTPELVSSFSHNHFVLNPQNPKNRLMMGWAHFKTMSTVLDCVVVSWTPTSESIFLSIPSVLTSERIHSLILSNFSWVKFIHYVHQNVTFASTLLVDGGLLVLIMKNLLRLRAKMVRIRIVSSSNVSTMEVSAFPSGVRAKLKAICCVYPPLMSDILCGHLPLGASTL